MLGRIGARGRFTAIIAVAAGGIVAAGIGGLGAAPALAAPALAAPAPAAPALAAPAPAAPAPAAPAPRAQAPVCPDPGDMPNPNNGFPAFTDNAVSVFVGGDFFAEPNAAESEGLHVVVGSAEFSRPSLFNIGSVGVGSGIVPTPGSVMLAVGEDMTVVPPASVSVGANVTDASGTLAGGAVNVGGTLTSIDDVVTNNAGVTTGMGAAAIAPWVDFPTTAMQPVSTTLAAATPTGTTSASGNSVTFVGDGTAALQQFTIDAADLPATPELFFTGIPADASIAVTVTGGPVSIAPDYFSLNGTRADDLAAPAFGQLASHLLWNFTGSTSVTIGGSSQFLGSILGPAIDLTTTASTNGRIYVGGDFHLQGSGAEHHNYPWTAQFPCYPTTSAIEVGSVTVSKTLTPGSGIDKLHFTGTFLCREAPPHPALYIMRWGVTAGESQTLSGLPIGSTCQILENTNKVTVDNGDGTFSPADLGSLAWADPVVTVDGTASNSFTVDDATAVEVQVTNTLLGTFTVTKQVSGPAGGYLGTGTFDVDWTCDADGFVDGALVTGPTPGSTSGTISVAAGATGSPTTGDPAATSSFPVGTTCVLTEQPDTRPGDLADGFGWTGSVVSPSTVTIGADSIGTTAVTVTNSFASIVGGFTASKSITGTGAAAVPAGTVFTLRYTYQGQGGEVAGSLALPADGSVVAGPQNIPDGTVVTFTEVSIPHIDGVVWGTPEVTVDGVATSTATVHAGSRIVVSLRNTATTVPPIVPPTVPPVSPPTGTGTLSSTGVDVWQLTSLAGAGVLAGLLVLLVARRRRVVG